MKTILVLVIIYMGLATYVSNKGLPYQTSDHFDGKKFFNTKFTDKNGFINFWKWQLEKNSATWPEFVDDNAKPEIATTLKTGEISTTYVNHITHLIQVKNLNLLTDPMFSERASPLQFVGPKRARAAGISFPELPRIDVVLISHNHYDHMDKDSIRRLVDKSNPTFIVPIGNAEKLKKFGASNVIELDWWQSFQVNPSVKVTVVPAQHWSKRTLFDSNKALWGGFVIESSAKKIYFAGDTGYGDFFKKINKKFGAMDLSFIPIGAYEPRWFMASNHLNPDDAVLAHFDLKSKKTIGTHFGTFKLSDEAIDQPAIDLATARKKYNVSEGDFIATKNGQTIFIK